MNEQTTRTVSTRGEIWRFVKYTLVAASAGLIETGAFYLLGLIPGMGYWACYLPALIASVVWNFTLNRRYTFHSAVNIPKAMIKVLAYYAVFTPLSTLLGNYLVEIRYPDVMWMNDAVYFVTLLVNFLTEFLYQRGFVFRGQIDTCSGTDRRAD